MPPGRALDTLDLARRRFPGAHNTLDALCRRFGVDNSGRVKHGALLDSELLAEVYLELIGGRQPDLTLSVVAGRRVDGDRRRLDARRRVRARSARGSPPAEAAAHAAFVAELGGGGLWPSA